MPGHIPSDQRPTQADIETAYLLGWAVGRSGYPRPEDLHDTTFILAMLKPLTEWLNRQ